MDNDITVEFALVLLGAAYIIAQLTGDSKDGVFVQMMEKIVKWIWRK